MACSRGSGLSPSLRDERPPAGVAQASSGLGRPGAVRGPLCVADNIVFAWILTIPARGTAEHRASGLESAATR